MKRLLLIAFILSTTLLSFSQHYILQSTAGPTGVSGATGSAIYQDASGNIGIGTTGPQAALDVRGITGATGPTGSTTVIQASYSTGATSPPNYFIGSRQPTGLGTPTTDFMINYLGQVGIGGPASSPVDLSITDHGYNACVLGSHLPLAVKDDQGHTLAVIANVGNSTTSAGGIAILSNSQSACTSPLTPNFAFGVLDQSGTLNNPVIAVTGDDHVAFNTSDPIATVDVNVPTVGSGLGLVGDNLFHIGNYNTYHVLGSTVTTTGDYFAVDNNGFVGIGQINTGASLLQVSDVNSIGAGGTPLLSVDNGSTTTPYFMVRGSSSGVNVGIGVDPIANTTNPSTLAINGNGVTALDLYGSGTLSNLAEMRFIDPANGTVRHVIGDGGNLVLFPGVGDGANNMVEVDGSAQIDANEEVESNAQIDGNEHVEGNEHIDGTAEVDNGIYLNHADPGSSGWYNQFNFQDGSGNIKQTMCNAGDDLLLNLNPYSHGSGLLKIAGTVQIGSVTTPCVSGSCYSLYVEKGILAERFKCAAASDATNWSDYVFSKSYKLMSVEDLEKFVKKNKHLPNIPTANDVKADGIDLGDMDAKFLAKIEELSLYIIEQQKQINELKKKVR